MNCFTSTTDTMIQCLHSREKNIAVPDGYGWFKSPDKLLERLINEDPRLLLCIKVLQTECIASPNSVCMSVEYTDILTGNVLLIDNANDANRQLFAAVNHHWRECYLVFPEEISGDVSELVKSLTESSSYLNCYLQCVSTSLIRKNGIPFVGMVVHFTYLCSYAEMKHRNGLTDSVTNQVVENCRENGIIEDWKKALWAIKYLMDQCTYGSAHEESESQFTAYGALVKHKAVCMGIALAVCELFTALGIPCRYVHGMRDGIGHAWNLVYIRGGWFYIDVTDAITSGDPLYHWGMTTLTDRKISSPVKTPLVCNCTSAYIQQRIKDEGIDNNFYKA